MTKQNWYTETFLQDYDYELLNLSSTKTPITIVKAQMPSNPNQKSHTRDKKSNIKWASCQMRKIAGCACARNAGNVFHDTTSKETVRLQPRHASRRIYVSGEWPMGSISIGLVRSSIGMESTDIILHLQLIIYSVNILTASYKTTTRHNIIKQQQIIDCLYIMLYYFIHVSLICYLVIYRFYFVSISLPLAYCCSCMYFFQLFDNQESRSEAKLS